MSSLRPSEDPSEDLTSLLDLDMPMATPNPPSPAPTTEQPDIQHAPQPRCHVGVSRSEGDLFDSRPLPAQPSIRARIQEDAAMRLLDTNLSSRDPLSKFTRAIMPTVHDASPTSIYDHIDDAMLKSWEKIPGKKVLVQPFDDIVTNAAKHEFLRLRILSAVNEITQAEHVRVSAPILLKKDESPPPMSLTPTAFLVCNITASHVHSLLERYVWASSSIAFRVIRTDPPPPNYLFTIKGLGTMYKDDVREIVQSVWNDEETTAFLTSIVDNAPLVERRTLSSSLRIFITSLEIERLDIKECGDTLAPHYNILANGPAIPNDNIWSRVRSFLSKRTYMDVLIGIGTTDIAPYKCTLCHAVSHPRGLCLFPSVKGWNSPIYQSPVRAERTRGTGPRL